MVVAQLVFFGRQRLPEPAVTEAATNIRKVTFGYIPSPLITRRIGLQNDGLDVHRESGYFRFVLTPRHLINKS